MTLPFDLLQIEILFTEIFTAYAMKAAVAARSSFALAGMERDVFGPSYF